MTNPVTLSEAQKVLERINSSIPGTIQSHALSGDLANSREFVKRLIESYREAVNVIQFYSRDVNDPSGGAVRINHSTNSFTSGDFGDKCFIGAKATAFLEKIGEVK